MTSATVFYLFFSGHHKPWTAVVWHRRSVTEKPVAVTGVVCSLVFVRNCIFFFVLVCRGVGVGLGIVDNVVVSYRWPEVKGPV